MPILSMHDIQMLQNLVCVFRRHSDAYLYHAFLRQTKRKAKDVSFRTILNYLNAISQRKALKCKPLLSAWHRLQRFRFASQQGHQKGKRAFLDEKWFLQKGPKTIRLLDGASQQAQYAMTQLQGAIKLMLIAAISQGVPPLVVALHGSMDRMVFLRFIAEHLLPWM